MPSIGRLMAPMSATAQISRLIAERLQRKQTTTIVDLALALGRPPELVAKLVARMVACGYLNRMGRIASTEGRRGRTIYTLGAASPKQLRSSAAQAKRAAAGGAAPRWLPPRPDALRSMVAAGSQYAVRTVRAAQTPLAGPQFAAALRVASRLKEHAVLLHSPAVEISGLALAGPALSGLNY